LKAGLLAEMANNTFKAASCDATKAFNAVDISSPGSLKLFPLIGSGVFHNSFFFH
jgi:hypothetical protein